MIREYTILPGSEDAKCCECGTREDIVIDDDGDFICTDCLFELQCEGDWPEEDFPDREW